MTRAVGAPQNLCVMISRNHLEETSRRERKGRKGRKGRRSNRTFAELPSLTSLTAEQICPLVSLRVLGALCVSHRSIQLNRVGLGYG